MPMALSERTIVERAQMLPAFPTVVNDLLMTLDDDNATIGALIQLVGRDPVITARVLSIANAAAMAGRLQRDVRDMQVAVSLIGISRLREIVLTLSLAEFADSPHVGRQFWEHSVAVGVAAQELARMGRASADFALVCGLLHDIGQLWMARCYPLQFQMVRMSREREPGLDIIEAERRHFGLDHCAIGAVLAGAWHLPPSIVAAIGHHHDAHPPADKLVAATHVGEALVNALDLVAFDQASVVDVSASACELLSLHWDDDLNYLLGHIEARSRHLSRIFS